MKLKTPEQWQEELSGETSVQSIAAIQHNAMVFAAEVAKNALYAGGRRDEGRAAQRAILDAIPIQ